MSTLHRLKAYFGMVPADDLDDYGDPAVHGGRPHRGEFAPLRDGEAFGDEYDADYDGGYRRRPGNRSSRWNDHEARDYDEDYYDDEPEVPARRAPQRRSWANDAPVRGALAMDPAREIRAAAPPVEDVHPMSRITTLHPQNYNEARTIGEHYRDGIPVIMNLTAMNDADAKRLVDFAAGLAFALRGSIDKITTKVFLISPANVDVTAEDKRRIAEGSFLPPHFKHG